MKRSPSVCSATVFAGSGESNQYHTLQRELGREDVYKAEAEALASKEELLHRFRASLVAHGYDSLKQSLHMQQNNPHTQLRKLIDYVQTATPGVAGAARAYTDTSAGAPAMAGRPVNGTHAPQQPVLYVVTKLGSRAPWCKC